MDYAADLRVVEALEVANDDVVSEILLALSSFLRALLDLFDCVVLGTITSVTGGPILKRV